MEKLCIFCTNIEIEDSRGCGGTYTGPWGEIGPSCKKAHFDAYDFAQCDEIEEYRALILKAETCPDYDQVDVKARTASTQVEAK